MTMTTQTIPNMMRMKRIHCQYMTSKTDGAGPMKWIPVPPTLMTQQTINHATLGIKTPRPCYNPKTTIKRAAFEELIERKAL